MDGIKLPDPESKVPSIIPRGMRPGQRQLGPASLMVNSCDAVPEHMRAAMREVTGVYVPVKDRRKRLATMLMNFICQEADSNGITLLITAEGDDTGGPDEFELVAWYEKFGFQVLQRVPNGTLMARRVSDRPVSRVIIPSNATSH